jgi:hypothetical protein
MQPVVAQMTIDTGVFDLQGAWLWALLGLRGAQLS